MPRVPTGSQVLTPVLDFLPDICILSFQHLRSNTHQKPRGSLLGPSLDRQFPPFLDNASSWIALLILLTPQLCSFTRKCCDFAFLERVFILLPFPLVLPEPRPPPPHLHPEKALLHRRALISRSSASPVTHCHLHPFTQT